MQAGKQTASTQAESSREARKQSSRQTLNKQANRSKRTSRQAECEQARRQAEYEQANRQAGKHTTQGTCPAAHLLGHSSNGMKKTQPPSVLSPSSASPPSTSLSVSCSPFSFALFSPSYSLPSPISFSSYPLSPSYSLPVSSAVKWSRRRWAQVE